jgi:hypothetical protein
MGRDMLNPGPRKVQLDFYEVHSMEQDIITVSTVSTEPGFYEVHEARSMILLLEGGAVDATYNTQNYENRIIR